MGFGFGGLFNIPSTHWCFFLADLDGATQVKYLLQYKDGFA